MIVVLNGAPRSGKSAIVAEIQETFAGWTYDVEVDTSFADPAECAETVARRLTSDPPPTAFSRLATFLR